MHRVSKKVLITVLTVVLMAVCVIGGLWISGRIQKEKPESTTQTTTERVIEPLPAGKKVDLPQPVRGTKLYLAEAAADADAALSDRIAQIVSSGFNAVYVMQSEASAQFTATDDMTDLADFVRQSRAAGLYTAVRIQMGSPDSAAAFARDSGADCLILSDLFEKSREQNLDALRETIYAMENAVSQTQVSALLWDVPFDARLSAQNAGFMTAFSKALEGTSCTGLYVSTDISDNSFSSGADAWLGYSAGRTIWFGLTDQTDRAASGFGRIENALSQTSALMKLQTAQSPVSFVFTEFATFSDDAECTTIVQECMTHEIIPDSLRKAFHMINQSDTSITMTESEITFLGECSPAYALTCNGERVAVTEEGFFVVDRDLQVGTNKFDFVSNGKTYTYTVLYQLDLIRSISPSGTLQIPGGSVLEITVVAHRKASVYATLNGAKITLVSSNALLSDEDAGHMDTSSDYVSFTGKYNVPESTARSMSLGSIKAFASYQNASDSISGASVTVTETEKVGALPMVDTTKTTQTSSATVTTAADPTTTEPSSAAGSTGSEPESEQNNPTRTSGTSTTATVSSTKPPVTAAKTTTTTTSAPATTASSGKLEPVLTPYKYNGISGTKRMCKIVTYYTETMPLSPVNDMSVPLTTPLPTGTFDFITGESSFDKYTYYNLGSGRRVARKDVEVIEKGYALPANVLTLVSSGTSSGKTNINLHLKWKVPYNSVLNGQKYINDPHNKREYAVSSLNAKSLDITFYYTAEALGQPNVSGSGVISSCEWIQSSSAQTCTLRLYLRSASRFYGYSIGYNADDTLRISVKEKGSDSMSGKTVMLDPGHGGVDVGATCAANSSVFSESKLTMIIAEKTKAKLQAMGASVLMTRTGDTYVKLEERRRIARTNNPDVFVSIHMDASPSSAKAAGTTAFYYRPYSRALAQSIHTQIVSAYDQSIYGTRRSSTDRGTVFYPYSVTRIEECPAVLIECGFVSNLEECRALQTSKHQDSIAAAIANGIRDYFASN